MGTSTWSQKQQAAVRGPGRSSGLLEAWRCAGEECVRDGPVDERDVRAPSSRNATTAGGSTGSVPGPPDIEKIVENDRQASQSCECRPRC